MRIVPAICVFAICSTAAFGQVTSNKPPATVAAPSKPGTLEQNIADAMKNNPDIRVAEAKLREAEAQLQRARAQLISELTFAHSEIKAAEAAAAEAEARFARLKQLHESGATTAEERDAGAITLSRMKAELATKMARLAYLLGQQRTTTTADSVSVQLPRAWHDRDAEVVFWSLKLKSDSPLSDKLRSALDASTSVDVQSASVQEVVEYIREKMLPGINVHVRGKAIKNDNVTVRLPESVPVGAVLQYLEDELEVVFVLRDYGIVVVAADERLPPDTVRVVEYWKLSKTKSTGQGK
jgi:hypothetical protein